MEILDVVDDSDRDDLLRRSGVRSTAALTRVCECSQTGLGEQARAAGARLTEQVGNDA